MRISTDIVSTFFKILGAAMVALTVVGTAQGVTYDFNKFLSGGGGGSDPKKRQIATSMGAYVCVDVREGGDASANNVLFTIWSAIPQPKSRIRNVTLDTGRHSGLFSKVSVLAPPPGSKAKFSTPQFHPFLRTLTPDYWIDIPAPGGVAPGGSIIISATLASGKTFADVTSALTEGVNPSTAATGLRVGVIVNYLLGGPPPGVGTIQDDGGFVNTAQSALCRGR